jgi:hypothetical protein
MMFFIATLLLLAGIGDLRMVLAGTFKERGDWRGISGDCASACSSLQARSSSVK